ncbi:hypothetical protein [Streptomyces toxytricini]|uniref:hypothetical protein n=1 Tax=Streptomyces toxytricini TaxID=67369 RepID=UPI003429B9E9
MRPDALVAGLDTPGLRTLAACTRTEAACDVLDLLPPALGELGLVFYPFGSPEGVEPAARAPARRVLAGGSAPWNLTFWSHKRGESELPLLQRLAELDEQYTLLECSGRTVDEVDAEVTAMARRLAARP